MECFNTPVGEKKKKKDKSEERVLAFHSGHRRLEE